MPQGLRVGNLQNWMILFERKLEVGGKERIMTVHNVSQQMEGGNSLQRK